jgi:molybdopterin synthase catalytic subunit
LSAIKTTYKYFVDGPVNSEIISELVSNNQSDLKIGAQSIFLGQVRADEKDKSIVQSIQYSAYVEMAEKEMVKIKDDAVKKYELSGINMLHSLGEVKCGEISVLVMVSSAHRDKCFKSLKFIVNEIKSKVPIWKKEIFNNGSYRWVE